MQPAGTPLSLRSHAALHRRGALLGYASETSQDASLTPGPGVDIRGNQVIDPTRNVLDLVNAAVRRLDDMLAANTALAESREKRQDDLRSLGFMHVQEMAALRTIYEEKLRDKETQRIDAIRAVDVQNAQRASEVSAVQATTLATQVQTSAETLRTQVATTATAQAAALAAALEPIQKDISELRKTQYEQQGQKAAQTESKGASQWTIGVIVAVAVIVVEVLLHFLPS